MKKGVVVLLHIGYWAIFGLLLTFFYILLIPLVDYVGKPGLLGEALWGWARLMSGFAVLPGLISFYLFYFVVFNRFFAKRKILLLFAGGIAVTLIAGLIGELTLSLTFNSNIVKNGGISVYLVMCFGAMLNGIIGLVMRGFITSYSDIFVKEELRKKNEETELALIKAQLQPHFLFNTINNIDVLIKKNPDEASEYLNKLSDLLRFMLYETKTDEVDLKSEIENIEKYIALQRIRTSNPDYIRFTVTGSPSGKKIAPMLYLSFIENAFKHAGNKKIENAIDIHFDIREKEIIFSCINHVPEKAAEHPVAGGLGNELIRKRLALLYPGKHELNSEKKENRYYVSLTVQNK